MRRHLRDRAHGIYQLQVRHKDEPPVEARYFENLALVLTARVE